MLRYICSYLISKKIVAFSSLFMTFFFIFYGSILEINGQNVYTGQTVCDIANYAVVANKYF